MQFNNNIYQVLWKKLVVWLLPLRRQVMVSWMMQIIQPIIKLYNELLAFREAVIYHLTISPQVCKLEKLLNDRYDTVLRRIEIEDAPMYDPIFLHLKIENKQVFFHTKPEQKQQWYYTKSETAALGVDFIIKVPVFVVIDINELTSLVKRYKLASKTFKVQIV